MTRRIIGFGYRARSGKDTAVKAILEARAAQFDVRRYSLAAAVKREINALATVLGGMDALCELVGVPCDAAPDMSDPECPLGKQRALLQWYGTDFWRRRNPDKWVRELARQINREQPAVALVSDVRFRNEADWIRGQGGVVIKVERIGYRDPTTDGGHVSECELEGYEFGYTIRAADGDVDTIRLQAVSIFDRMILA